MRGHAPRHARRHALLLAVAVLLPAGAACRPAAERGASESEVQDTGRALADFRLTIVQSGGIAGTVTTATVDGESGGWTLVHGRPCAADAPCPAGDSLSGALPERDVRAIRQLVAAQWESLIDDYGRSEQAADLYAYEFEARLGGRTKRFTADDLTLPPELRAIRDQLFQAIDSARGR